LYWGRENKNTTWTHLDVESKKNESFKVNGGYWWSKDEKLFGTGHKFSIIKKECADNNYLVVG
jgi:hypothetical protein